MTTTKTIPVANALGLMLFGRLHTELTEGLNRGVQLLEEYKDHQNDCPSDYQEVKESVDLIRASLSAFDKLKSEEAYQRSNSIVLRVYDITMKDGDRAEIFARTSHEFTVMALKRFGYDNFDAFLNNIKNDLGFEGYLLGELQSKTGFSEEAIMRYIGDLIQCQNSFYIGKANYPDGFNTGVNRGKMMALRYVLGLGAL